MEDVFDMIEVVVKFLKEGEEDECITSQQHLRIINVVRGKVIKDWKGSDFQYENMKFSIK